MSSKWICSFVLISFVLLFASNSHAQFNVKIGYTADYLNSEVNNKVFERYNESKPWLEAPLGNLHFLHGIQLGTRYKFGNTALELTWQISSRERNALGEDPLTGVFFEEKLFYGINTISLGFQNNYGLFGWGATIDSRRLRVKTNIGTSDNKREILKETGLSSKFHLSLNVESGDFMSLSIQPFVQIPWDKTNFFNLESDLFENPSGTKEEFDENLVIFGISVVFYNGVQ